MATYKITFVCNPEALTKLKVGPDSQRLFAPWAPKQGLRCGESIALSFVPDCCKGPYKHHYLVDGKQWAEPKKPKAAPEKKSDATKPGKEG